MRLAANVRTQETRRTGPTPGELAKLRMQPMSPVHWGKSTAFDIAQMSRELALYAEGVTIALPSTFIWKRGAKRTVRDRSWLMSERLELAYSSTYDGPGAGPTAVGSIAVITSSRGHPVVADQVSEVREEKVIAAD
jgi:hypothetical protein